MFDDRYNVCVLFSVCITPYRVKPWCGFESTSMNGSALRKNSEYINVLSINHSYQQIQSNVECKVLLRTTH